MSQVGSCSHPHKPVCACSTFGLRALGTTSSHWPWCFCCTNRQVERLHLRKLDEGVGSQACPISSHKGFLCFPIMHIPPVHLSACAALRLTILGWCVRFCQSARPVHRGNSQPHA